MDARRLAVAGRRSLAGLALGLAALATTALTSMALAAGPGDGDARNRYDRERAACFSLGPGADRAACLREAGAARDESRRRQLGNGSTATPDYEANARARCAALPADQRGACEARMRGEGTTRGSVAEGGIYREYRETVPAEPGTGSR